MKTATTQAAHGITRRSFVGTTVIGLSALSARRVLGANERINVALTKESARHP